MFFSQRPIIGTMVVLKINRKKVLSHFSNKTPRENDSIRQSWGTLHPNCRGWSLKGQGAYGDEIVMPWLFSYSSLTRFSPGKRESNRICSRSGHQFFIQCWLFCSLSYLCQKSSLFKLNLNSIQTDLSSSFLPPNCLPSYKWRGSCTTEVRNKL